MNPMLAAKIDMEINHVRFFIRVPVVAVYVWRTTTALDNRKKKRSYESSNFSNYDSNSLLRSVGHAGIGMCYNNEFLYRGFGPVKDQKDIKLTNPFATFKATFRSFRDDVELMGSMPDCRVYLHHLNFKQLYHFLKTTSGAWGTYNLYKRNCSTFVLSALKIGAGHSKPAFWKRSALFLGNLIDFTKAFAWLFPSVTMQQKRYWATLAGTDSNPLLVMDHAFKTLGGVTPDAVLRYSDFLYRKEQIDTNR